MWDTHSKVKFAKKEVERSFYYNTARLRQYINRRNPEFNFYFYEPPPSTKMFVSYLNVIYKCLFNKRIGIAEISPKAANFCVHSLVHQTPVGALYIEDSLITSEFKTEEFISALNKSNTLDSVQLQDCGIMDNQSNVDFLENALRASRFSRGIQIIEDENVIVDTGIQGGSGNNIRKYWFQKVRKAIASKKKVKYQRAKLMFVGNGGAGKTSTIHSLFSKDFRKKYISTVVGDTGDQLQVWTGNMCSWKFIPGKGNESLLKNDFKTCVSNLKNLGSERISPVIEVDDDKFEERTSNNEVTLSDVSEGYQEIVHGLKIPMKNVEDGLRKVKERFRSRKTRPSLSLFQLRRPFTSFWKSKPNIQKPEIAGIDPLSVTFAVWDFGGQEIFYTVHHLFLTDYGIYVVVFNIKAFIENSFHEMNVLKFWLESIALHASNAPALIIGTRSRGIKLEVLQDVSTQIDELVHNVDHLTSLRNSEERFSFFPIDNSLGKKNEKFLAVFKRRIEKYVSGSDSVRFGKRAPKIPLSWLYFLDQLIKEAKTHLHYHNVVKEARFIGFSKREVNDLLTFYTSTGTIVHFANNRLEKHNAMNNIVILQPQWLIEALACILYDVKVHGTRQDEYEHFRKEIFNYEKTATLPEKVLEEFWKDYGKAEVVFLKALNLDMLLMSKYVFNNGQGHVTDEVDLNYFVVPGMLQKKLSSVEEYIPQSENRLGFVLFFDGPIRKGMFQRVVCYFVNKSGQSEGSFTPSLYTNFAEFRMKNMSIFVYQEDDLPSIRVVVRKEHGPNLKIVLDYTREIFTKLVSMFYKSKAYTPLLLLEAGSIGKLCDCDDFQDSILTASNLVKVFGGGPEILTSDLKDYLHLFESKEVQETVEASAPDKLLYDCFLAHEWGTEASNFATHKRVVAIKEKLEKEGLKVWVDAENIRQHLAWEIIHGLKTSRKVVVFLTKRYLERVDDEDNNCAKELNSATKKGLKNFVVVLLDEELKDPNKWFGHVAEYELGHKKYVDFSNMEKEEENFKELVQLIRD